MRLILASADFSGDKGIGTMNSWFITYSRPSGLTWTQSPSSVTKGSSLTAKATLNTASYELTTISVAMGGNTQTGEGTSNGITISKSGSEYTINITAVSANVNVTVVTQAIAVTPSNYTLTINPTPTDATVTLTASGYSQSGNSITVANGTSVSWRVSKSGYTEQNGTWIANGANETKSVTLSTSGGSDPAPDDTPSNYTLIHGNKYASGHETNPARASISPLTIIVPKGVTITNKSTIKWAYYTGVNTDNMPSGTGSGTWGDYKYTGTGAAIGISFKKVDDSEFDWSIDSTNPANYFDVSDEGLWNGTAEGTTPEPEEPNEPEGTLGDITTLTLVNGNPYGTAEQQVAANRVHGETALYAPAGTVISCKDTTTYKWALRRVKSETDLTDAGDATYKPDSVWTTKTSYTTEKNGYWCFILLKASNADFDWNTDSNKVSDYFTVS